MTLKGFEYLLLSHGVRPMKLIGHTCSDEALATRGEQITDYLESLRYTPGFPCQYVVLDDLDLGITPAGHPLVLTNGDVGLTEADADLVIKLLSEAQRTE
jgi:hypothetical protein